MVFTSIYGEIIKANTIVVHSLYIVVLNFTYKYGRFLIDDGYKFAEVLSGSRAEADQNELEQVMVWVFKCRVPAVNLSNVLNDSMDRDARRMKQEVIHEAIQTSIQLFNKCVQLGFSTMLSEKHKLSTPLWFPTAVILPGKKTCLSWSMGQQFTLHLMSSIEAWRLFSETWGLSTSSINCWSTKNILQTLLRKHFAYQRRPATLS